MYIFKSIVIFVCIKIKNIPDFISEEEGNKSTQVNVSMWCFSVLCSMYKITILMYRRHFSLKHWVTVIVLNTTYGCDLQPVIAFAFEEIRISWKSVL